jgi:hypothetical protein
MVNFGVNNFQQIFSLSISTVDLKYISQQTFSAFENNQSLKQTKDVFVAGI